MLGFIFRVFNLLSPSVSFYEFLLVFTCAVELFFVLIPVVIGCICKASFNFTLGILLKLHVLISTIFPRLNGMFLISFFHTFFMYFSIAYQTLN